MTLACEEDGGWRNTNNDHQASLEGDMNTNGYAL
jgi:hypothetical protein